MRRTVAVLGVALVCLAGRGVSAGGGGIDASPLREFDGLVASLSDFATLLEQHSTLEAQTNDHLDVEELAFLEADAAVTGDGAPTYTLPYPPVTFAATAAGGFVHPYTNVNPLAAPFAGFAPVTPIVGGPQFQPIPGAAMQAAPITSLYYGRGAPSVHAAMANHPAFFPNQGKGGYNEHGLMPQDAFGVYHPNLAADIKSLSGKPKEDGEGGEGGEGGAASLLQSEEYPLASATHDPENIAADADNVAYGVYPAPAAGTQAHFQHSADDEYMLGPHKLEFARVGENQYDAAFPAFVETDAESETEAEAEADIDADVDAALETESEFEAESDAEESSDHALLEGDAESEEHNDLEELDALMLQLAGGPGDAAGGDSAGGEGDGEKKNPTYVLPYPPVLPGHYAPLFNPYTNVNPLSTPYANYAAQPGAHPQVAAAAAVHATNVAISHGQIAGQAGGYPYYPFAARDPYVAAQLQGNPIYPGAWIHPQNLNSAAVGDNADAASLGQFIEMAVETEHTGCVGCEYD